MINTIKTSKVSKIIASYLAIQLLLMTIQPSNLYALTSGPSQPEFNSFTPIGTSDMVNLFSGDFNYNIPIMDVGGYPLNLAYDSGITMDQEASWVGLGWNLNVGQIARNVRGIPDDFNGDEMIYENDIKDTETVGTTIGLRGAIFGVDGLGGNASVSVEHNNYNGFTFRPSLGVSYDINKSNVTVGLNISSATGEGASINPSVSVSAKTKENKNNIVNNITGNFGLGLNSRQGVSNLNLSFTNSMVKRHHAKLPLGFAGAPVDIVFAETGAGAGGAGGAISFNDFTNYTPTKTVAKNNESFTFNASGGLSFIGIQGQGQITGYGSYQSILPSEKYKTIPAFGYENTEANEGFNGILDFNREKDQTLNKFSTTLPITNYSYDIYAVQCQGAAGTFRPFRSQVSYVYDNYVSDTGAGNTFGFEAGGGNLTYAGAEVKIANTSNTSGKWVNKNNARNKFIEKTSDNNSLDYEPVYFKGMGELDVDREIEIYQNKIYGDAPIRLEINGSKFNKSLRPTFKVKNQQGGEVTYNDEIINSSVKRTKRELRNQAIQKITKDDAKFDPFVLEHTNAKGHHTVGVKTIKPDGSTYVFGEAAYNTKKVEATFDVSGQINTADCYTGLVSYNGTVRGNSNANSNNYLNRITTPAYAHTYLLSSVLSSDYEDVSQDGPTDDDLGAYTKFNYSAPITNYQWRIPFQEDKVTHNEGLKTLKNDETGSYIYGTKELKYISTIETKTHVAVFRLSDREDAIGAKGESGGMDSTKKMKKIDEIYLYSKPEYKALVNILSVDQDFFDLPLNDLRKSAIKIAHFNYNYSLCGSIPNNSGIDIFNDENENINLNKGKLTLEKIYFTYRNSNMGKYTPYIFNYGEDLNDDGIPDPQYNPNYDIKNHDIWGCYKENEDAAGCSINSPITNAEFPFVKQDRTDANKNVSVWHLRSIDLPSGGTMEIETEADDYKYVQEWEVMSMIKVSGAGNHADPTSDEEFNNNNLFDGNNHHEYLYVKLPANDVNNNPIDYTNYTTSNFREEYIGDQIEKPIYFRFLLNMDANDTQAYDYVTGYFEIEENTTNTFISKIISINSDSNGNYYASIKIKSLNKDGGFVTNNQQVNPITKAGWHYGRTYMNNKVYTGNEFSSIDGFEDAVVGLWDALEGMQELVVGPNQVLQQRNCAQKFISDKSWIRLKNPNKVKLGGGLRVKRIILKDNWDGMTGQADDLYKQQYGQEYDYNGTDGLSSGVATFEPNGSKENPFVEPFFGKKSVSYADRLVSPNESNYVEKPFGETFFPTSQVTYGRVTVNNLKREDIGRAVTKHATGKVVTEFYTSKNFPTIVDYTNINEDGLSKSPDVLGLFNLSVRNHLTLSQGYSIITNNMNGMQKRQEVFAEGQSTPISGVEYLYNEDENKPKTLNNVFPTIDKKGDVESKIIGQSYDVVNDFRENKSVTEVGGVNSNVTSFLAAIFPVVVPMPLPTLAYHENILRTAVTTKVVHKMGVLKEKIAYDLGSRVSTKNVAWDAHTGQVLLTETINEYDDNYYNLTYPAHWAYEAMDKASYNIGLKGQLVHSGNEDGYYNVKRTNGSTPSSIVKTNITVGDEIYLYNNFDTKYKNVVQKLWVAKANNYEVLLMTKDGFIYNVCGKNDATYNFKIVRSGYRNQQMASMASITSMVNPIVSVDGTLKLSDFTVQDTSNDINAAKIINASAVQYKDYWRTQLENDLPGFTADQYHPDGRIDLTKLRSNPFLYNVKNEWRANTSWAYLAGRKNENATPRDEGFFKNFSTFYKRIDDKWKMQPAGWTYASEVSKYSPYGAELENKDALDRYSSAQYGYNYTLPVAVASNSEYREMGFDGFEDYDYVKQSVAATVEGEEDKEYNGHFSFYDDILPEQLVDTESHTGKHSAYVTRTKPLVLKNYLEECIIEPLDLSCGELIIEPIDANKCLPSRSIAVNVPDLSAGEKYIYKFSYVANSGACWFGSPIYSIKKDGVDLPNVSAAGFISQGGAYVFTMTFPNGIPSGYDDSNLDPVNYGNINDFPAVSEPNYLRASLDFYAEGTDPSENLFINFGCFNDDNQTTTIAPTSNNLGCGSGQPVIPADPTPDTTNDNNTSGYSPSTCSSFRPIINNKYVVSAWVKDVKELPEIVSNSQIKVYFQDVEPQEPAPGEIGPIDDFSYFILKPQGKIIDGWQLIRGIVSVPEDATQFNIKLAVKAVQANATQTQSYFDDVRVMPFNGNMKSFVYDEVTQRLMAELDENNYATFYEYDLEGGLVRVKKETEQGVYTIQETRSGNSKLNN